MKNFTLFNIKWHPIRFNFWIFAIKSDLKEIKTGSSNCKMQSLSLFLSKNGVLLIFRVTKLGLGVEHFQVLK